MPIDSAFIRLEVIGEIRVECIFDPPLPEGTQIFWTFTTDPPSRVKVYECSPHPLLDTSDPDAKAEAEWESQQQRETGADRCPPRE